MTLRSIREANPPHGKVVALSGGVGGAKLATGLASILPADQFTVIVNTGDDFEHLGLSVSPDLDSLMYALAGLDDKVRGWGRADETWNFMEALAELGGESWFRLGDRDLATHLLRTQMLRRGMSLTAATAVLSDRLHLKARLLPMSNDHVRTQLRAEGRWIDFQSYFVAQQCRPVISSIRFDGIETAHTTPEALEVLADPALRAIVICPSNPLISIGPILAVPGMRAAIKASGTPVVAVSPVIAGRAVKGPTAKMLNELGQGSSPSAIADIYRGLIDVLVIDEADAGTSPEGMETVVTRTLMTSFADREALAAAVLNAADGLSYRMRGRAA